MGTEIKIKRAVLHVLDNQSNMFIPSQGELEITDELSEYISKHIQKTIDDANIKKARFIDEDNSILNQCKSIDENNFLLKSTELAYDLFELMVKHIDIPSADVICSLFEQDSILYLGMLKLNYKTGYTHWVNNSDAGNVNTIIRHKTLLPLDGQKVDECLFIQLGDFSIKLLEKQYEIDGQKDFYLSSLYLRCTTELSTNAKLKILDKVAKNINKKYYEEDFQKAIEVKKAVAECLEENEAIRVEKIAQKVYEKNPEVRNEYVREMVSAGLTEKEITVPEKFVERKLSFQKIKTDTGIEINFPLEYAGRKDRIEFINNSDGTIAIVIKNVGRITNR